ncbi:MAG: vitamin K epoxide reductase family protein [Bacteroidota bacterium]
MATTERMAPTDRPARPLFHRLILGLALVGVFLVAHLYSQQTAGFNRGCLGLSDPATVAQVGCETVTSSAAGQFLGVSNVVWGFLFYLGMVALRFAMVPAKAPRKALRTASLGLATAGFAYSLYLVSVQLSMGTWCVLCTISAGIVTVIFGLHLAERFTGATLPTLPSFSGAEFKRFGIAAALIATLSVADIAYFNAINDGETFTPVAEADATPVTPVSANEPAADAVSPIELAAADEAEPTATGPTETPATDNIEASTPAVDPTVTPQPGIAPTITPRPVGCEYETGAAPLRDISRYTTDTGFDGRADAPVTVVKIFDPNCPHCRTLHHTLDAIVGRLGDKAKVHYYPFALWQESIPQIQALYIAHESGKASEMLAGQFAMQENENKRLLTSTDLSRIATDIGLDADAFARQLSSGAYAMKTAAARDYASVDIARGGGVSVPKLTINGRFVAATTAAFTTECISALIEEAHAEVTGG